MNQLRTLITLAITAPALAQPLVRPSLVGLTYLNANQAFIQEPWTIRVPGTTPCPFIAVPPYLTTPHGREFVSAPAGANLADPWPCSWTLSVIGDTAYPLTIKTTNQNLAIAWARNGTVYDTHTNITLNPCDVTLDNTINVFDFMTFLNNPYDYNGDGTVNVFDFNDFLNTCN